MSLSIITRLALGAALLLPMAASAQVPLRLEEALRRADDAAYANRIAAGRADAQEAQTLATYRGVLPSVRMEAGWVRTTDPIGAFGTTLRQRSITQADFDPTRLNDPSPIANWGGALIVEQPLFNADAHLGRAAASKAAAAADASVVWTRAETRLEVVRAYYGAVLAAEKVATLEAAVRAAQAHVKQARTMVETGFATRSDALLAEVKAGEVEADLASARGDADLARRGLSVLLGAADEVDFTLPARLPDPEAVRRLAHADVPVAEQSRGDVAAAREGLAAARADVRRAKSLYVPRVNAFARLDWNSDARPYAGEENWTAGVMLSWSPFAGASEISEIRAAAGRERAARAGAEAARAQAKLEVETAETRRRVAQQRLDIAERATRQSIEAHRIVERKYEGGLATVAELLDAAAVETQSGLGRSAAIYAAIVAEAERRHAAGLDLAALAMLDNPEPRTNR